MRVSPHEFGKILSEHYEEFNFTISGQKDFQLALLEGDFFILENNKSIYRIKVTEQSFKDSLVQVDKFIDVKVNHNQQLSQLQAVREFIALKNFITMECEDPFEY